MTNRNRVPYVAHRGINVCAWWSRWCRWVWDEFRRVWPARDRARNRSGIALMALMVELIVMHIFLGVALPDWVKLATIEKERELIWRAGQYVQAIEYFYYRNRRFPTVQDFQNMIQTQPPKQRLLRRLYREPFVGRWLYILQNGRVTERPVGPVVGVTSADDGEALIQCGPGRTHREWRFVFNPQAPHIRGCPPPARQVPATRNAWQTRAIH